LQKLKWGLLKNHFLVLNCLSSDKRDWLRVWNYAKKRRIFENKTKDLRSVKARIWENRKSWIDFKSSSAYLRSCKAKLKDTNDFWLQTEFVICSRCLCSDRTRS